MTKVLKLATLTPSAVDNLDYFLIWSELIRGFHECIENWTSLLISIARMYKYMKTGLRIIM